MEKNTLIGLLKLMVIIAAGSGLLFWSVSKASLENLLGNNNEEKIRVVPITFYILKIDGSREKGEYKLPEAGMLPNSPWYGFKSLRDWIWIRLSSEGIARTKMKWLVADKKLAESLVLKSKDNEGKGWQSLVEASGILSEIKEGVEYSNDNQLLFKYNEAVLAYIETANGYLSSIEIDKNEVETIINNLRSLNGEN